MQAAERTVSDEIKLPERYNRPGRGCWLAHHCLLDWRDYRRHGSQVGYPSMSSDAAARERAQTATVTDGEAAYRGRVEVGDKGKTVPKDPPPMPKETKPSARSRVPPLAHGGGRARDVDRALLDLCRVSPDTATVLRAHYLLTGTKAEERAKAAGMPLRRYWDEVSKGLMFVQAWLMALKHAA
jgi:hypothetical protein